ncbi:hypothetical protein K523DRAFT_255259, partial [Schizophyllum commune Tattone D]
ANSPNPNRGIKSPVFSTRGFRRSLDASFSLPSFGSSSMSDNLHHTSPIMYPNSPSLGRWTLGGRPRGASASEGSLASQTAPPRRTSTDGERASLPTVHSLRQGTWGAASGRTVGNLVYGLLDLRGAIPGDIDRVDRVPKSLYWGYALLCSSCSKALFQMWS